MTRSVTKLRRALSCCRLSCGQRLSWLPEIRQAAGEDAGADVKPIFADKLPNVPGKSITAVAW